MDGLQSFFGVVSQPPALMLPCDTATLAHVSTVQPRAKEVSDRGIACTIDAPLNYHNRN
jgi:hypothetical protein